jgi:hypothetical protein
MYLHYFNDIEAGQRQLQWRTTMSRYAASLAGVPAEPSALPQVVFQLIASREMLVEEDAPRFLVREQLGPFFAQLVERPPDLPLLAIRAARRAVAANPRDANAWLRLGQAYLLLRNHTVERSREGLLPPLAQLRQVQIVTTLEQAVRLDPNLEEARHQLAFLYGERNALDRALDHRREELRISRQAGPRPGEGAEDFAYRIESLEKDTAKLVELVEDRRRSFVGAPRSPQGDRLATARLALDLGLVRTAVEEVLMMTPPDLLGAPGIQMELDLLLSLGQAEKVRVILNDDRLRASKHGLGIYQAPPYRWPAYEWLHVIEAAAVGDYAQCREDLRAIRAAKHIEHAQLSRQTRDYERRVPVVLSGLLSGPPRFLPAFTALAAGRAVEDMAALEANERILRAQQADLCVLEGMLALEQGDTVAARSVFAEARELGAAVLSASRPIAASYFGELNANHSAAPTEE